MLIISLYWLMKFCNFAKMYSNSLCNQSPFYFHSTTRCSKDTNISKIFPGIHICIQYICVCLWKERVDVWIGTNFKSLYCSAIIPLYKIILFLLQPYKCRNSKLSTLMLRPLYQRFSFKGHQERGNNLRKEEDIDRRKQTKKKKRRI